MTDTICDRCGTRLLVGQWPFCPHEPTRLGVIGDSIPGGMWIENLGPEPVWVYSETERRRIMKARGLRDAVKHTPGSCLTSNWNVPSATTLENARILVSRTAPPPDPLPVVETFSGVTITVRGSFHVAPGGEPHDG